MRPIVIRTAAALLTGIATAAPNLPADAQTSRPVRALPGDPYAGHIAEASRRFGIPATWIRAVMRAESAGDTQAVSHAGAIGLMQVMPATWADLRVRHRLGADPYDPRDNILAGTAYPTCRTVALVKSRPSAVARLPSVEQPKLGRLRSGRF